VSPEFMNNPRMACKQTSGVSMFDAGTKELTFGKKVERFEIIGSVIKQANRQPVPNDKS